MRFRSVNATGDVIISNGANYYWGNAARKIFLISSIFPMMFPKSKFQ